MKQHWSLDPEVTFLNHGSFGACPRRVLAFQSEIRAEMERGPVAFMLRKLPQRLEAVRAELAEFVGALPKDLVFGSNATAGVNAVVRSLRLAQGDEILTTNHAYGPCQSALDFVASRAGAKVVVADVPFPIESPDQVLESVLAAATSRTRLALVDHVTSTTGLVYPIAALVEQLQNRGVQVLVDGAHAPGMVPLDLEELQPDYYTANLHKWVCAPKGAGMLWVHPRHQQDVFPLVISQGYGLPEATRFQAMFDWPGTFDPSAWLSVGEALRVLAEVGGGWPAIRAHNTALALKGREILCHALNIESPAPVAMVGALASIPLPPGSEGCALALHKELVNAGFEVPVFPWGGAKGRVLRVSAQLYNEPAEYERLAVTLQPLLAVGR
jgi:isopenicillin-N epimerase